MMEEINKRLVQFHGKTPDGFAKFRLVFSDQQYEIRVGNFEIWAGDIWLRNENGPHNVQKYNHLPGRWILEIYYKGIMPPEIVKSDPYECLWAFKENQIPVWPAIEKIIHAWYNRDGIYRENKRTELSEEEKIKKEVEDNYIRISNNSPVLATLMSFGSAAFFDSTKQEKLDDGSDSDKPISSGTK